MHDFDTLVDRQGSYSHKWDIYSDSDIDPFWMADMEFACPPEIVEAVKKRAAHPIYGYTYIPDKLRSLICSRLEENYGWRIEKEWLVFLPGLGSGLSIFCNMWKNTESILISSPIYYYFFIAAQKTQKKAITVPLVKEKKWVYNFGYFENAIQPHTKSYLFCNPQNPTGRIYSREELEELLAICKKHDIVICSDEIHCDLLLSQKKHIPLATVNKDAEQRTITLMAPSKTYNIAGLRLGFAIIPNQKLRNTYQNAMRGLVPGPSVFGLEASLAAYSMKNEWLEDLLKYLRINSQTFVKKCNEIPYLSVCDVEATYLAWIDCTKLPVEDPHKFFEEHGVGMSNGKDYGFDKYVRFNFGCPYSKMETALSKMKKAVCSLAEK